MDSVRIARNPAPQRRLLAWIGLGLTTLACAADPAHVIVDDAWSGQTGCHFSGRLTEAHPAPSQRHGGPKTLYRNTRLLLTRGREGAVTWRVGAWEWNTRTDDSGYWSLATNLPLPLAPGWHEITAEPRASGPAGLLVLDPANRLGIISDIDDTIVVSGVLEKRTLLKNSLVVPPERREAVADVARLYQRLLQANPAPEASPVFYVSASPKQLTDNLRGFLRHNGFPRGVLRLKEISEDGDSFLGDQQAYKTRALETVLRACPGVRFNLFGDDGEQDPEIYDALRKKFPAQIAGVWIRRVSPDPDRARFPGQDDLAALLAAPAGDRRE
ncbi:MAG TPA: phosphatase domain-containing protein [Rariglobus sp.]